MRQRQPFVSLGRVGSDDPLGIGFVSDEERTRLHDLLDRVLDQRENLEGWWAEQPVVDLLRGTAGENTKVAHYFAREGARLAFDAAVTLAAEALGSIRTQSFIRATDDPHDIRWNLWARLHRVRKLIDGRTAIFGRSDFPLTRILDELENLSYGDAGEIFRAPPLKPSQRHNRGKLAKLRLKALAWDKWLRTSQSLSVFDAHRLVAEAYRTDWDAIRKWRKSCVGILGPTPVNRAFDQAAKGHQPAYGLLGDWKSGLLADGESYQKALREEPPNRTTSLPSCPDSSPA